MNFSDLILDWYDINKRDLPWRKSKDPYKIWISEIILQQTKISQGTKYYLRFLKKFPNLKSLANSSENEVLLSWQGLGYYSRARNLHKSAKKIYFELENKLQLDQIKTALRDSKAIVFSDNEYHTPIDSSGNDAVYVSRLRKDLSKENGFNFWVVSDNLLKGAALNSVQIAESLIKLGKV